MQLSVFSPVLSNKSLEESLKYLKSLGVDALELGCGGYPGTAHADAKELIKSKNEILKLKELFKKYDMNISALSVHGNAIHPNTEIAEKFHNDFVAACKLAGELEVERVITFSGCAGDGTSKLPNWVTCPWPNEFSDILNYQWNDVLLPYWTNAAKLAKDSGVKYIGFEMHPGFMVYNPETLIRVRNACGNIIGANLDPSHLVWQGIDVVEAIDYLGEAIHFFHAKDTELKPKNLKINGVLDTKSYADERNRSWLFRTVGYGNDALFWKKVMSALRLAGYDHAVSIEHEDSLMTPQEGLEKAVKFMKEVIIKESNTGDMWWV